MNSRYSRSCNPRNFWGKSFDMIFFSFKNGARDEHGKVGILDTQFLDLVVEPSYNKSNKIVDHEILFRTDLGLLPKYYTTMA
jgi:hypothetical protein